ncbi:branched-chain amino acid transport system ATP-binding protein [Azospirillum agricola]|uniref:ABC transporter ATP-binding protein n=1 Tax=Azospirillum agricola TaxID=1720247 RepID=UPI001AE2D331|nr:ABC transporter ATP-binding protein [Azospirillum agricola]MBP2231602.1 branched-chain amino acid transport system ATP-binding protein [Azospirillum agricola]
MLTIENLHAHYGLSHVLQGVSLHGGPGEVVGLFGRNGVGKTTILKTIAGWVPATSGSVRLDGADLAGRTPDAIARLGLGLVPEDRRIFPGLSVEENLRLGLLQCPARSRRENEAAIGRAFARFPRLAERRHQMGTTLSGGEQQMLAMARVMVGTAKLLLIDEPTEGLAPMIVDEIFAIIGDLKRAGLTILLVEQNIHRALDVADRFYAVERGRVTLEGDAASPKDRARLMETVSV